VVTGSESRLYLVKLNQATGALVMDDAFHDAEGKPGFNFENQDWPRDGRDPASRMGSYSPADVDCRLSLGSRLKGARVA
jgi:hypothetical protein